MLENITPSLVNGRPLTKTQLKKLRRKGLLQYSDQDMSFEVKQPGLKLKGIRPKTINQNLVFEHYQDGKDLMLHGYPGTGKTFLAMYLALKDVIENKTHNKVVVVRSAVATRDIGHLPGNAEEKMAQYEMPYMGIVSELFYSSGKQNAYKDLKAKGQFQFVPTSYVRGITIHNAIVIVDECENLTYHELDSIITRLGDNCRIIFCGDFRQSDLKFKDERKGLLDFMAVVEKMSCFEHVEMKAEDIVRSAKVKEYILAKASLGHL